ncbi:MAG: hypothetical protein QM650_09400 [Microlunatus sp.]
MATKYRLQLSKLKCNRKQDTVGRDDPKILVDGKTVYGPGDIGRGETVNLNRTALFTTSAQVQLVEVDAGNDDDMGTITIRGAAQVGQGDQVGEFHRTHADYELTYQVVTA